MASPKKSKATWAIIIRQVQTPLAFYVLALLIVETALTVTLGWVKDEQKLAVFSWIIAVFMAVIAIVTGLAIWIQDACSMAKRNMPIRHWRPPPCGIRSRILSKPT